jgi:recombination protein RecR
MLPESITSVTDILMRFPAVGRRSSQRIALQILEQSDTEFDHLIEQLQKMKQSVTFCPTCSFFSQNNLECDICRDHSRSVLQICILEKGTDVIALEKSLSYHGRYQVLSRLISPLDNIFADNTNLPQLFTRIENIVDKIRQGQVTSRSPLPYLELIFFLQPSFNAEATLAYVREKIQDKGWSEFVRLSKLAQGLPSFYNVDTLDQETLSKSIEGRIAIS